MRGIPLAPYSVSPKRSDLPRNVLSQTRLNASLPVNDCFTSLKFSGKETPTSDVPSGGSEEKLSHSPMDSRSGDNPEMSIQERMAALKRKIIAKRQQQKAALAKTDNPFAQEPTPLKEETGNYVLNNLSAEIDDLIREEQATVHRNQTKDSPQKTLSQSSVSARDAKEQEREPGELSESDSDLRRAKNNDKELFPKRQSSRAIDGGKRGFKRPRRHETFPADMRDGDPFLSSSFRSSQRTRTLPTNRELEQMAPPIPNHNETDPNYWWNLGGEGLLGVTPQQPSTTTRSRRPTLDLKAVKRFIDHDLSGH